MLPVGRPLADTMRSQKYLYLQATITSVESKQTMTLEFGKSVLLAAEENEAIVAAKSRFP